jgi:hypothetical protein
MLPKIMHHFYGLSFKNKSLCRVKINRALEGMCDYLAAKATSVYSRTVCWSRSRRGLGRWVSVDRTEHRSGKGSAYNRSENKDKK